MIDDLHQHLTAAGYPELRPAHGYAFQAIGNQGIKSSELAQVLGMTKQAAQKMIDLLENYGYVTREAHPEDRRGKLVQLTQRGRDSLAESGAILRKLEKRWAEVIGQEQLEALRADLQKVIDTAVKEGFELRLRPIW
jgi:DNA-binding MarR family transcriptional regulator